MDIPQPSTGPNQAAAGADKETREIKKVALYAFMLNLVLVIVKAVLAIFSGSLAVTASAIDSGTDAIASLVLLGGLSLSTRKSPAFPLGLYKIENMISVIVALFIFFAGYEIAREVLAPSSSPPRISMIVLTLLSAGVAATFLFGRYAMVVGRRTGSPTLIAEGRHRQVDVLSSLVVLVSVVLGYVRKDISLFGISVDQIAAGCIVIFIAHAGWGLLADGMRVLLDASVDFETLDQVKKILEDHPMVVKVRSLTGRNAGRFRFLQAALVVRTDDLKRAHEISEALELEVREKIPHVERVLIHYESQRRIHLLIAVPVHDAEGKLLSDHFGEAPYFAFLSLRVADHQVEEQKILENPHRNQETAKGIRVAEWLVGQNIDGVIMKEDLSRKGPGYVLANGGAKLYVVQGGEVGKVIESVFPRTNLQREVMA